MNKKEINTIEHFLNQLLFQFYNLYNPEDDGLTVNQLENNQSLGLIVPPVIKLQIRLALGSFLYGCSFNQSLT